MSRHKTPLRYPGGKQKLAPFVAEVLAENNAVDWTYVEPYAGGAGVALELLLRRKVKNIHLNDSSIHIFAFWHSILTEPEKFCRRVSRAPLNVDEWRKHREVIRNPEHNDLFSLGFSTFYLNRCNRSGVLTGGVIGGLEQKSRWKIDARFSRSGLIERIERIAEHSKSISLSNLDAEELLTKEIGKFSQKTLFYCDPPYYMRSQRLYLNSYATEDHARIAGIIQTKLKRKWIVSYDGHNDILRLYADRRKFLYSLQYSATKAYKGSEVFIFSDNLRIPNSSILPFISDGIKGARKQLR